MNRLESYFISQLRNVDEIKEIIRVINIEFDRLQKEKNKVLNNMFLTTLDEYGCVRYEKMFNITPRADDTLEDRRFTILSIYKGDTPYTLIALRRKLENLCGAENVEITLDENNYKISILIGLGSKNQYDTALKIIKRMLPCNLVLDYELKYNQHLTLAQYTHGQLSNFTHDQLRNYVINIGG